MGELAKFFLENGSPILQLCVLVLVEYHLWIQLHIRTNVTQITYQAFLKRVDLAGYPLVSFLEGYPKVATAYMDSG